MVVVLGTEEVVFCIVFTTGSMRSLCPITACRSHYNNIASLKEDITVYVTVQEATGVFCCLY